MIHWKSSSWSALLLGALSTGAAVGLPAMAAAQNAKAPATASKRLSVEAPAGEEAATRNIENAAVGLVAPGGLYGVESTSTYDGGAMPAEAPAMHVVKKGDTLWSLCDHYFRDPWSWPKLWSQNPLITNPHWIFPGDVVRLRDAAGAPAATPPSGGGGVTFTSNRTGSLDSNALVLRENGYVQANELASSARITGSREEKIMLSTGDQAYLTFAKDRPLKAGERYTVYVADMKQPVRAPGTGAVLGYIVRIYGEVVVDQIADGTTARGTLLDVVDPIERGFLVSPRVRQFKRIEPRPSAVSLEVQVVASLSAARMLAADNFVVLSRGSKDGIQVGNRTFIVRRGDGYRRMLEGWEKFDANYPKEVVGELFVVDVGEATSLAWIARTSKEIRVGETAEMRKGY